MPKRGKSYNKFDALKAVSVLAIVIYIIGVVPQFTDGVRLLFRNPLMKVVFLALIVFTGYLDSMIGTLLAIAFIMSYLGTPNYSSSPAYHVLDNVRVGTQRLVGGVGGGAQQLLSGVGYGAQELVGGVGYGAQELVGGVKSGAQRLIGGVGSGTNQLLSGAQSLVGGVSGGAQELIGGVGSGTQRLLSGAQTGGQQLLYGVESGGQQLLSGVSGGAQRLLGGNVENLENAPLSISQAYQQQMHTENGGDKGCSVQPAMETGCDPIVGYNSSYNGGGDGDGECKGKDPACLYKGVSVWKDELNAQGLNFPIGYSGGQVGSTY